MGAPTEIHLELRDIKSISDIWLTDNWKHSNEAGREFSGYFECAPAMELQKASTDLYPGRVLATADKNPSIDRIID